MLRFDVLFVGQKNDAVGSLHFEKFPLIVLMLVCAKARSLIADGTFRESTGLDSFASAPPTAIK